VGNSFAYNQSVTNVNVTVVHNTYNETVINNVTVHRVSYNGGGGGTVAAPGAQERRYAREERVAPTSMQRQHLQQAAANPDLLARNNGGRPAIAATAHPAAFNAAGVVRAHGAAAPPPHAPPAVANGNRPFGGPGRVNGANAPHPQTAYGKPPAQKQKAEKPHPNKAPPENGRREPETAQR
jgi:hypothetical protein